MSALAAPLAERLDIRRQLRATAIARDGGGWRLQLSPEGDAPAPPPLLAETVALAIPAPQARALMGDLAAEAPRLAAVAMAPCWTVIAGFAEPLVGAGAVIEGDGDPLARAISSTAKPGRPADPEAWAIHAGALWSRTHLEAPHETVSERLLSALSERLSRPLPRTVALMAHRWRYALTDRALGDDCLWLADHRLGCAGDWCPEGGARAGIAAAWRSGGALAARILAA